MSKELEAARLLVKMLEEKEKEDQVLLGTLEVGESFMIGKHEFIVIEKTFANGTILATIKAISKELIRKNVKFGEASDYNKSNLKKVIEEEIQPMIESEFGEDCLVEHEFEIKSVDNQICGKFFGKVRPITFDEARKNNNLIVNKELEDLFWTITPWSTPERGCKYGTTVVSPSGNFSYFSCGNFCGVRPLCILKSNIFVSRKEK